VLSRYTRQAVARVVEEPPAAPMPPQEKGDSDAVA
jgi:hypothetical protein